MADDIIKNPNRSLNQRVRHEPEHVRLGIDVPEAPVNIIHPTKKSEPVISVDGSNLDNDGKEIQFDNGHIIDNNDYVSFGYGPSPTKPQQKEQEIKTDNTTSPKVGDYVLMVLGKLVMSGSTEKIEAKIKGIMYGEDELFKGTEISTDDIVVLKRLNIKIGIFIEE